MEWSCTKDALTDLEKLLTCGLCENYLSDPCTLENCDHNFCRKCIEKTLGGDSKCPECGVFSWLKDLRANHQLTTTVAMTLKLRLLIGSNKRDVGPSASPPENTITFGSPSCTPVTESIVQTKCSSSNEKMLCSTKTNNHEKQDSNSGKVVAGRKQTLHLQETQAKTDHLSPSCTPATESEAITMQTTWKYSLSSDKMNCNKTNDEEKDDSNSGRVVSGRKQTLHLQETQAKNHLSPSYVPATQSIVKTKYSLSSDKMKSKNANNKEKQDLNKEKVVAGRKQTLHSHANTKEYLLRNKSKRQSTSLNDKHVDTSPKTMETVNTIQSSKSNFELNTRTNEPADSEIELNQDSCLYENHIDVITIESGSGKNESFTHVKDKLPNSGEKYLNHRTKKGKQTKSISSGDVNKVDDKVYQESIIIAEGKENCKLNVKRRKARPRKANIRKYLVEIESLDDSSDSSIHCTPSKIKKRTSVANSAPSENCRNKKGETSLHLAAIKGDLVSAHQLIKEGANPNTKDNAGWTPLHEACNHGHVNIVELFLNHGALLNTPGFDNDTPLHDAVANGRLKVVKLLVERGASLTARNKQGLVPKDYAGTETMKNILSPRGLSLSKNKNLENIHNTSIVQVNAVIAQKSNHSCSALKVVLGTALSRRDREILEKCVQLLGGIVISEFNESVTHIVTSVNESGHCPRTMKYFSGILTGKWIVSFTWITDCLRKRQWLSEDVYEVEGTAGKSSNGPKKARYNTSQELPRLFDGCGFYLRGSFNPQTPGKGDLLNLIKLGGGKILHREPKVKDDDLTSLPSSPIVTLLTGLPEVAYHLPVNSSLACCTQFIIYDPSLSRLPKIIYSPFLCTAPVTWLMNCISSFEFFDIPDNAMSEC